MAETTTRLTPEERAKITAWDFLAAQGEVPEGRLPEYLDNAIVYAHDETGYGLPPALSMITTPDEALRLLSVKPIADEEVR